MTLMILPTHDDELESMRTPLREDYWKVFQWRLFESSNEDKGGVRKRGRGGRSNEHEIMVSWAAHVEATVDHGQVD